MPRILDRMPFPNQPGEVAVRGTRVPVRADQLIVWISLGLPRIDAQRPAAVPFPAILDTGHSHSFAISERHLLEWAGLRTEILAPRGAVRDRGRKLLLWNASLWAHANKPRSREQLADRPAQLLEASAGIAVYPGGDFPRLPILGLRAIAENNLLLKIDGPKRQATLRTPFRWRVFS